MAIAQNSKIKNFFKWGGIAILATGLIFAANRFGVTEYINSNLQTALRWIDGLGFWGPLVYILLYILAAVCLISGAAITLGAGVIFDVVTGSIYVSVASTLGATAAFLIGRYLARGWVAKQIEKRPKFQAIDTAVAKEGWKIVILTRLSPLFPYVFLNYAFGVTKVSLKDYFLASWLGMLPATVMYVYIGSLAKNLATLGAGTQQATTVQWIIRIVGFVATVGVTLYVTKIARRALNSEISQTET